jgi:hypothetical protein
MARAEAAIKRTLRIDSFDPYRQTDQKTFKPLTYGMQRHDPKGAPIEIKLVRHPSDPQCRKNKPA